MAWDRLNEQGRAAASAEGGDVAREVVGEGGMNLGPELRYDDADGQAVAAEGGDLGSTLDGKPLISEPSHRLTDMNRLPPGAIWRIINDVPDTNTPGIDAAADAINRVTSGFRPWTDGEQQ
jgi:hypothetical protein